MEVKYSQLADRGPPLAAPDGRGKQESDVISASPSRLRVGEGRSGWRRAAASGGGLAASGDVDVECFSLSFSPLLSGPERVRQVDWRARLRC